MSMPERHTAATGLARRSRRLSDEETRDRMLKAALARIERTGLTVSLEHLSFEDVIREADVSRSTAYRHWPYKDMFFGDLVAELAGRVGPTIIRDEIALLRQVLAEHDDWLATAEGRQALLLELIRRLALLDFQSVLAAPAWRTYLALHATVASLADDVRDQVRTALARADTAHTAHVARAWHQLAALFGYRLRPELATTYDTLATLLSATMRGLVVAALSRPEAAEHRTVARPPGAAEAAEWSLAGLGIASLASAFLEPDPHATWDEGRLAEIHRVLDAWVPPDA
jgi:AcrR family transcriptional regulator